MSDKQEKKEKNKVISFEENKDIKIPDSEHEKEKQAKKRAERERKKHNDTVLRNQRLGKYKTP